MKKILYIADTFPFPYNTGGKLRTANIMMQLHKKYDIDFVSYSTEPVKLDQIQQISEFCNDVKCFDEGIPSKIKRVCNILKMKSNKAFIIYSKKMQRGIDQLLADNEYSFIVIERLYCYPYIEKHLKDKNFKVPVFLNMHDVEHESILYFRKISNLIIKKIYYSMEYVNVIKLEKKAISNVTKMIAVSKRDMECYMKKYPFGHKKWICVNNGVDIRIADKEPIVKRDEKTVLFLGSLKHPPNIHGLEWFVKHIWGHVIKQEKDAKLLVVGSGEISAELKCLLASKAGIEYLGYVENVYPLLRSCTGLIVPLLSGSGTRMKILEAFSFRAPVVSTTIGAEGLPVKDGVHLLIADNEIEIADKIVALFHSSELGAKLAQNGYELVCREYDWDLIGDKFLKVGANLDEDWNN